MKSLYTFFCVFLALCVSGVGAQPSDEGNLLKENEWAFYPGGSNETVERKVSSGADGTELAIRLSKSGTDAHVWWYQRMESAEGDVYNLSFEATGGGEGDRSVSVGVDFLGDDKKYLSYKEIAKVCYTNAKWSGATLPDVKEWKAFEKDFTVPRGARFISLRLALGATAPAEARFKKVVLTKRSVSLAEVLNRLPREIPVQQISIRPVSAKGVTLTPDWRLQGAEIVQSQSRTRVCLNGLWAIAPSNANETPKPGDWAFMKVPNVIKTSGLYLAYGQDETSWKGLNLPSDAAQIWFVRDVEVPKRAGGKIELELSSHYGFALAIYWNGKHVGNSTNQFGDKIDLSSAARPGERGQLAIYALAVPAENTYAYLMEAGQMVRQYKSGKLSAGHGRGLTDIYLNLEPAQRVFETVQTVSSTRRKLLELWITGPSPDAEFSYGVTIRGADGSVILEKDQLKAERRNDGWAVKIPWENPRLWTPDDTYLHRLTLRAVDSHGKTVDETLPITFGFREVWVEGKHLMLNGRPLRLRPKLALTDFMDGPALRRYFSFLKDLGFNCVLRPGAGASDDQEGSERHSLADYYNAADEVGIFIIAYTPYSMVSGGQFGNQGVDNMDLDLLMRYLRKYQIDRVANHPSLIAYSGFGSGCNEGINSANFRPDIWGVSHLGESGVLDRVLSSPVNRANTLDILKQTTDYVQRFKQLDPTRPFLAHLSMGEADGWGIFDYFNWTPVQEWEEWPLTWWNKGVMPIGSTEHGLPYPSTFLSHAIPDGNCEPWVTEYSAIIFGQAAYSREPASYLNLICTNYDKASQTWPPKNTAHHQFGQRVVMESPENTQAVWVYNNRAIYRTWRTYGIPMGIEPFGPPFYSVDKSLLVKDEGKVIADPSTELRTTGAKMDRWVGTGYWTTVTMPWLPTAPTGQKPEGLTPLGDLLYEVNSPLLVYLAGPGKRFTAKDHVFVEGEKISKQIAAVWDGFQDRDIVTSWKATVKGTTVGEGRQSVTLKSGDIRFLPVEFAAPAVGKRSEGTIELTVTDAKTGAEVARDSFGFQVYPRLSIPSAVRKTKIVAFDPAGDGVRMLKRLGMRSATLAKLSEWKAGDILVVGRGGLAELGSQSLDAVPSGVPILVLEQDMNVLENLGFRTYPTRTRRVFALNASKPLLRGVGAPDLYDWRVEPKLLPGDFEPLRDGYNYHTGYYGTVASVTIETPTKGNFKPLLQCGFDLRETPLLEANFKDRRWVFCQLSVVDPGTQPDAYDPVGSRILVNLLGYLANKPAPKPASFGVLGEKADANFIRELGASIQSPIAAGQLGEVKVAVIGKTNENPEALKRWVEQGGIAVVMPQAEAFYKTCMPLVYVARKTASLAPVPNGWAFDGLGQANFHYRQPLSQLTFNGDANAAQIPAGKGFWVLLGFDPRSLDVAESPWLRLSYANQSRTLAQILTNLDVPLGIPGQAMSEKLKSRPFKVDIFATGKAWITEAKKDRGDDWVKTNFDVRGWSEYGLAGQGTPYGDACLRISFTLPAEIPSGRLDAALGTIDDYDEVWLNGTKIGSVNPDNSDPEQAWKTPRVYPIPAGLLKPGGENILAIHAWNRNAAKGATTKVRGPMLIHTQEAKVSPYVGDYKHRDDPYLHHGW